jgi:hypothetical protein
MFLHQTTKPLSLALQRIWKHLQQGRIFMGSVILHAYLHQTDQYLYGAMLAMGLNDLVCKNNFQYSRLVLDIPITCTTRLNAPSSWPTYHCL